MSASANAELDLFRQTVNCAAVLERMMGGWKLDVRESTKRALKYRRGPGEIIIVNHDGHGWWDATGSAKGDVFNLVQHLDPSLNFGQVRQVLRRFVGATPSYPEAIREEKGRGADRPVAERWARRPRLRRGSEAWTYLTGQRALTWHVVEAAAAQDAVREGPYGSVWFAHRLHEKVSFYVEIRGPAYKGSLAGGHRRSSGSAAISEPNAGFQSRRRRSTDLQPGGARGHACRYALRCDRRRHPGARHDQRTD